MLFGYEVTEQDTSMKLSSAVSSISVESSSQRSYVTVPAFIAKFCCRAVGQTVIAIAMSGQISKIYLGFRSNITPEAILPPELRQQNSFNLININQKLFAMTTRSYYICLHQIAHPVGIHVGDDVSFIAEKNSFTTHNDQTFVTSNN